jgi:hypothetical protein
LSEAILLTRVQDPHRFVKIPRHVISSTANVYDDDLGGR